MKILVVGAGQGGMQAAFQLAKAGHEVTVYEKDAKNAVGHDQLDAVEHDFFDEMNIPLPFGAKPAAPATFVGPDTDSDLLLWTELDKRDWSIDRRTFSREQIERCENAGVKFCFETPVKACSFGKSGVEGIVLTDGETIKADLVIDAGGVNSPARKSFGGKFGITEEPEKEEVFNIVHTYYKPKEGVEEPEKYKYYLKYKGSNGICWCGIEVDGSVSTLIGNIGDLPDEQYEELFTALKEENPIISDEVLRGGHHTQIPVRYPAPIMVAPGYASVGDSAFMTIPLLGNGIASSIRAGKILADCIIESNSTDVTVLWKYQVEFFRKIGAVFCFVDYVKRSLLKTDNSELKYLFENGIVTNDDIRAVFTGSVPKMSPKEIADRVRKIAEIKHSLGVMVSGAVKGVDAMLTAQKIPEKYDEGKVYKWAYELSKCF